MRAVRIHNGQPTVMTVDSPRGEGVLVDVAPDRDLDHAARMLAERREIAEVLVTHRFPLDGAADGFAAAADRAGGAIKVLFEI